jgi:hypothetical protein
MGISLTREDLYKLVWSKPMTHVAKELGISDVMLGKICKERRVPRPERGYWANLHSPKKKGKYVKPPLPAISTERNGFCDFIKNYYQERSAVESRSFDWRDLAVEVPESPGPPTDTVDQRVDALFSKVPSLPSLDAYKQIHPVAAKFLASDKQRDPKGYFSSDRPVFADENGQRLLASLNSLCWTIERLGGEIHLRGRVHMRTSFNLLGGWTSFALYFHDPEPWVWQEYPRRKKQSKPLSIHLTLTDSSWGTVHHGGKKPEEFSLDQVLRLLKSDLREREERYREFLVSGYETACRNREYHIRELERKRLLKLKREREKVEAINARRLGELMGAVDRMRKADDIRELVRRLHERQIARGKRVEGFDKWSRWALQHAEQMDPSVMSLKHLGVWVRKRSLQ